MRSSTSGWSERRFTPNGFAVRSLTDAIAAVSSGTLIVALARMPRPPASLVAAVSRAPATQPMPVCTIGYRTPNSSHAAAVQRGYPRGVAHGAGISWSRSP